MRKIEIFKENIFFEKNPEMFSKLYDIIVEKKRWYPNYLDKDPDLTAWVIECTPLLSDTVYKITTRVLWIMEGRTDFPVCPVCGKPYGFGINIRLPRKYRRTCSSECAAKLAAIIGKKSVLKRYGVENVFQLEVSKLKTKTTKLEKYGDENFNNRKQAKATCIERYGVDNCMKYEKILSEYQQSMLDKYGCRFPLQHDESIKKLRQTCLKKYGVEYVFQNKDVYRKFTDTCEARYGVKHALQNKDIRAKSRSKYVYNGVKFDSSAELAYYIWLTDNGVKFRYNDLEPIRYKFADETFCYYPDFYLIDEKRYVELKGRQFFKSDGTMYCPYRNKTWSDETYDKMCRKYEAKHQCMLDNDVKIILTGSNEMHIVMNYCFKKYGRKDWFKQFKT